MVSFGRIENALSSERWPQLADLESLFSSPTQFSGLQQYRLPVERVIAAASQLESRSAHIARIRNIVIADAIDTHINNTGSVRSDLQQALKDLAHDSIELKFVTRWRLAGEWLLDFFQNIPLGAIFMMGNQTILYVIYSRHV